MRKMVAGILAHVDAGKTTLSEGILYTAGTIRKLGRVDHKDAFLDTERLERARGITIFSKPAVLEWKGLEITLLDTPGHVDFSAEMERALQVLDYAVLVVSGTDGVQAHTETLWRLLERYRIPVYLFANKMDLAGTDKASLMQELKSRLSEDCVDFSAGQPQDEFYENLAVCSELLLEQYFEQGEIEKELIASAVKERKVFPVYFGSALKLEGIEELLDGMEGYYQKPCFLKEFGAKVYKIGRDDQGSRLTYLKVTGGILRVRELMVYDAYEAGKNSDMEPKQRKEKIDQIRVYHGQKYSTLDVAEAGTVCAVTGLSATWPGQGLGAEAPSELPVLASVMTYRLILSEGQDPVRLRKELRQLEEEDPLLHIRWREALREIHVQMMGEVQIEVLKEIIWERFGEEVEFDAGSIVYRETIAAPVEGMGHYEPLRHYAEVHLLMEPGKPGSGLVFASACSEDELDRNWQRLVLTHLEEKEHLGVLTGSPITDMKITLVAGRAHLKHTEGGDFRQATYRAVRHGLMRAKSVLLEPIFEFQMEIPSESIGRAMADIERMDGSFDPPENNGAQAILRGTAPVIGLRGYAAELAAYTKGRGHLSCLMKGYAPCHNQQEIIEKMGYDGEADLENSADSVFCAHGAGFLVSWRNAANFMHVDSGLRLAGRRREGEGPAGGSMEGGAGPSLFDMPGPGRMRPEEDGPEEAEKMLELAETDPGGAGIQNSFGAERLARARAARIEDRELEEIFTRTYGPIKRRMPAGAAGLGHEKEKEGASMEAKASMDALTGTSNGAFPTEALPEYLLVDGYNVIFAWDELAELARESLDAARVRLMDILCNYQGFQGNQLILVFDAYRVKGNPGTVQKYHNIHVVYTKEAETADMYIEKVTHEIAKKARVTVATSDALEQLIVIGQGAVRISSRELKEEIERVTSVKLREYIEKQPLGRNFPMKEAIADLDFNKEME